MHHCQSSEIFVSSNNQLEREIEASRDRTVDPAAYVRMFENEKELNKAK